MSMSKMVPDHLKPQECKRIKLRKPPPVPYVPEKDEVQDKVSKMRNMEIKTTIEKDTTMNFPVWQENGTREAFLMHVTAVLDAIKKRGHFGDYDKAALKYKEASKAIGSARAGLSILEDTAKKQVRRKKEAERKTQGEWEDHGRQGCDPQGYSGGSSTQDSCPGSRGCSCNR